jgi:hypothetical protein
VILVATKATRGVVGAALVGAREGRPYAFRTQLRNLAPLTAHKILWS